MKFLIDAQLPILLKEVLISKGFQAIHVLDLPDKDLTTDNYICKFANENDYIVITKDVDFLDSFILKQSPLKLFLITTGNIKNKQLLDLIRKHLPRITEEFKSNMLLELNNVEIITH